MKTRIAAILLTASLALTACGSNHSNSFHVSHLTAKVECLAKYHKWTQAGGLQDFYNSVNALQDMVTTMRSHNHHRIGKVTTALENGVTVVQHHMPPNCVPGLNSNLSLALARINSAAIAVNDQNYPLASKELRSSTIYMTNVSKAANAYLK